MLPLLLAARSPHAATKFFTLLRGTCGLLRSCFRFLRRDLVKSVYDAGLQRSALRAAMDGVIYAVFLMRPLSC